MSLSELSFRRDLSTATQAAVAAEMWPARTQARLAPTFFHEGFSPRCGSTCAEAFLFAATAPEVNNG
jgi:hypothetical protein